VFDCTVDENVQALASTHEKGVCVYRRARINPNTNGTLWLLNEKPKNNEQRTYSSMSENQTRSLLLSTEDLELDPIEDPMQLTEEVNTLCFFLFIYCCKLIYL